MAEHLQKDAKTYADEYASFVRDLKHFHDTRGTGFIKLPRLLGLEVDLYLLYSLVTSRGGWEKVNINGDWESLLPYFGIHRLCANGPIALKQIYIRYLDVYERVHFLGEEVDRRESELHEEDDARNRRKALRLLHATPTSYNSAQHVVPDGVRTAVGFSTDTVRVTPTERIFLSLLCPLPNEQDFAINVCSLLAIENRKPFPLQQCPRIIDALLAHAGVFSQVDIRDLFTESYRRGRGQNLGRFWRDVVPDQDIVQLSDEDLVARSSDDSDALPSHWRNWPESKATAPPPAPSSAKQQPQLVATELDPEEESVSNDGHLFARPDERLHPVAVPDEEEEEEEEESQCSVAVFENGTDALPAAATSSEPNFTNCLTKSGIGAPDVKAAVEDDAPRHAPNTNGPDDSTDCSQPPEEPKPPNETTTTAEPESIDCAESQQPLDGAAPAVAEGAADVVNSIPVVQTVERRIPAPRYKLPAAVLKPDNQRAVRYWVAQRRRAARSVVAEAKIDKEEPEWNIEPEDMELFHLGRDLGVHDVLGQRVLQVLNIIRNLSFDDVNSTVLAQSEACVRLLLLSAHAKWASLPQIAFDALSNLASEVKLKDPADCTLSAVLLGTVTRGLESSDRFIIMRCMECLSRMAQRDENETLMTSFLDSQVYEKLCSYLTVPDVALLIYTLECVYSLSSLGQATCNAFLNCPGTLDVLISLLTIEAQSYGSKARILMNVVETVAEGETVTSQTQLTPMHSAQYHRPPAGHTNSPAPPSSAPSTPPPMLLQPVAVPAVAAAANSNVKIQPKPGVNSRPGTPTQSKSNSNGVGQAEKEQMAIQWLRSTFESLVGAPSLEQTALYKMYTAGCSRNGPKYLLGTLQFYSCVRATFGQNAGPFRKQVGAGVEFYFEGLSSRNAPTATVATASHPPPASSPLPASGALETPGSPILKAQLCAPPKANHRKETANPSLAHPHLSQALGQCVVPPESSSVAATAAAAAAPAAPSSSLIKSLLANKVPESSSSNSNSPSHVAGTVGLSPTATALPGMNRVVPCMNLHAFSTVVNNNNATALTNHSPLQVTQRQQQQRLLQQQQEINGPSKSAASPLKAGKAPPVTTKVNGTCPEGSSSPLANNNKGMLADLLEREVKKDVPATSTGQLSVNGATTPAVSKELRISDNGLELIPKDARGFEVDMGVVGMKELGVEADGTTPKAAHLIAQVDDSGHVQIHLEEEPDSSAASQCNGQSLLDQLEACEVSSSTDPIVAVKGHKRPAEHAPEGSTAAKKSAPNDAGGAGILEKAIEMTLADEPKDTKLVNGINGMEPSLPANPPTTPTTPTTPTNATIMTAATSPMMQPVMLGPNAPRTFLILQPQNSAQGAKLPGFHPHGQQRLLLAIQRPGGGVQHVAMPANMVAISSSQLTTSNGGVVTLTTSGGMTSVIPASSAAAPSNGIPALAGVTVSSVTLPAASVTSVGSVPITTVAPASSGVVTTSSMEGVVTFSGGAVAFPARPAPAPTHPAAFAAENHVTITPVSASVMAAAAGTVPVPVSAVAPPSAPPTAAAATPSAAKKRNNSTESASGKGPRGRPVKSKSSDGGPSSGPAAAPLTNHPLPDPAYQFMCEWKDCMKAFKTPHEVYVHACYTHCPAHIDELGCLWERCDGLKRKRFSMMTHLMDRHCNDEMQKLLAVRRFQMNTQGKTDIPAPQAPTPHPGYAPHAALHAIKRHAVELMNQKEQEEKEGPVTKSIRLTSALILRNIASHSSLGRRCLQRYESHLASVALSNVESSRTVAQILYELTHQCS